MVDNIIVTPQIKITELMFSGNISSDASIVSNDTKKIFLTIFFIILSLLMFGTDKAPIKGLGITV